MDSSNELTTGTYQAMAFLEIIPVPGTWAGELASKYHNLNNLAKRIEIPRPVLPGSQWSGLTVTASNGDVFVNDRLVEFGNGKN